MEKILQLTNINKILGVQLEELSKTNAFLDRQGQEDKNTNNKNDSYLSKMDPTGYCWTRGWRVTKGHSSISYKTKNYGHQYGATRPKTLGGSEKQIVLEAGVAVRG